MANLKNAKQEILVNQRNRMRNVAYKSQLKTLIKSSSVAIKAKADDREGIVRQTLKFIDRVSGKGIIHKNAAARKKSSLSLLLNRSK